LHSVSCDGGGVGGVGGGVGVGGGDSLKQSGCIFFTSSLF